MIIKKSITLSYEELSSPDDLGPEDRELLNSACNAAKNSYATYSHLKVGAAVRLKSGKIVPGTNIENAAFPSGICAERAALASASSNFPGDMPVSLAVAAFTGKGITSDVISPCGNCRQVIAEEEMRNGNSIRIILAGRNNIHIIAKGGDLLPLKFSKKNLSSDPEL